MKYFSLNASTRPISPGSLSRATQEENGRPHALSPEHANETKPALGGLNLKGELLFEHTTVQREVLSIKRKWEHCLIVFFALLVSPGYVVGQETNRVILVGDSTVTDGSGWGLGFKSFLVANTDCLNFAQNGRSSRSFRNEGWWKKALEANPSIVLIQFGHNDQPGKGPERESAPETEFREHLRQYVRDAREHGIRPVLITSLTRRRWRADESIEPTLTDYAEATLAVARELSVPCIDLHKLSIKQCESIGPDCFRAYEPMTAEGADHTHLNDSGSQLVGQLVVAEFSKLDPAFAELVDQTKLSEATRNRPKQLSAGQFSVIETDNTLTVLQDGQPVLVYNIQSPPVPNGIPSIYARSGFLHPVSTPKGKTITAAFPYDHAHQHGIFCAWVHTKWNDREIDFWNLAGGTGRVAHRRVLSTFCSPDEAGFEVELAHCTAQEPIVDVLKETWRIAVHLTSDPEVSCFDLEFIQRANTDIPLLVEEYHYGGLGVRGTVRWVNENRRDAPADTPAHETNGMQNELGHDRVLGNHETTRWVTLWGNIDNSPASISVLSHRDNFRFPQPARLHPTKPYFCFAPCVLGKFEISNENPLKGKYRFLLSDKTPESAWLQDQWNLWSTEQ
ncbi:MAG: PmoA family protein [Planctomycetales bacterium]|nr:PmoA family protein [Planctomycetales bacterium]